MNNEIELIRALSDVNGISGFEDDVAALLRANAPENQEVYEDHMRNLYLRRKNRNGKPVVMLDAHMDEVGFMVHSIRAKGTLKFLPIGGWVNSSIPAHRVRVQTRDGSYIPGVVGARPPHNLSEAEKSRMPEIADMSIDIGACSLAEARDVFGVRVAAPVVPDSRFSYDEKHNLLFGKAFDCRLGCAALMAALDELGDEALEVDPVAAFSVQEEVGLRGAGITAAKVKPDVAIVLEGCPADDTVAPLVEQQAALHKGPMLRHIDKTMIANPRFMRFALDLAREKGIPVQEGVRTGGGTNGGSIYIANTGIPTIVISLPIRYIHCHNGIASFKDYRAAVELTKALLRALNGDVIEKL